MTESTYKCKQCDFATEFVADVWKHTHVAHPDASNEYTKHTPKDSENIVLKIVAEQTNSLMGEVANFKVDTRNALEDITTTLVKCLDKINKDNNEKCNTLGNIVLKIYRKISKLEKALDKGSKKIIDNTFKAAEPKKKKYAEFVQKVAKKTAKCKDTEPPVTIASRVSTVSAGSSSSSSLNSPASFSSTNSPSIKTSFMQQPKILYVGDSVAHTVNLRHVEKALKCRIRSVKANSSKNFKNVVDFHLKNPGREEFDSVVMSAPSMDITNIFVHSKEEAEKVVVNSCKNMDLAVFLEFDMNTQSTLISYDKMTIVPISLQPV